VKLSIREVTNGFPVKRELPKEGFPKPGHYAYSAVPRERMELDPLETPKNLFPVGK